jgi:hypothetical protein
MYRVSWVDILLFVHHRVCSVPKYEAESCAWMHSCPIALKDLKPDVYTRSCKAGVTWECWGIVVLLAPLSENGTLFPSSYVKLSVCAGDIICVNLTSLKLLTCHVAQQIRLNLTKLIQHSRTANGSWSKHVMWWERPVELCRGDPTHLQNAVKFSITEPNFRSIFKISFQYHIWFRITASVI